MTERTLQRRFLDETGLTFGQWHQQARLLFALERLARGDRIIDVAMDSGYTSQSAFTAMFRRHFGAPPSRFYC
ncbi:helix-turn-helix domain-containing protein [Novosphingobium sp. UBA1939]|uniref:helix-turn-helix domain-containing protein n=1 Tax=Novosphingobium sp. UBA1939 TaxID=1946982 RepID=UPI0025E6D905|nr:helix-turn-helix domain-containing protein [Novosphingobium sp. UBA1939]